MHPEVGCAVRYTTEACGRASNGSSSAVSCGGENAASRRIASSGDTRRNMHRHGVGALGASYVKRKRVLAVVRWPVGGIRTYLRYVYGRLDRERYDFTIVGPDLEEMQVLLDDLKDLHPRAVLTGGEGDMMAFTRIVAASILRGKYDLIHSHGATAGMCSAVPAVLSRTPHVVTLHEVFNADQFEGLKGGLRKAILSTGLPMADAVYSVAGHAQDNILGFFPKLRRQQDKLVTIRNGIDTRSFDSGDSRDFRAELELPADSFLVGFLGRFMSAKGFVYLIDAMDELRRMPQVSKMPVVLAFGGGGFIREDTAYLRRKGLAEYFHFLPFTPDVGPVLRGLDLVAMPSLWEAASLLAMETLVAGVPLVASTCRGLEEIIKGTPATPVSPRDARGLAAAVAQRMMDPGKREAREYAKDARVRFDAGRTAQEVDELFSRLIAEKPRVSWKL